MDIKDFVTSILVDLDRAIDDARRQTRREIYFAPTSSKRSVEFDIALIVENSKTSKGKAGVKVVSVLEGGGEKQNIEKDSTVSRVQFGVSIDPIAKEDDEYFSGAVSY